MALQTLSPLSVSKDSGMENTYTYALLITHDSYDSSTNKSNITVKAYILCSDSPTAGATDKDRIFYGEYCTASCIINGNSIGSSGSYACYYKTSLDKLPSSPLWTKTIPISHDPISKKLTLNVSGAFTHSSSEIWMPPSGMNIVSSGIELTNPKTYKISYNKNGGTGATPDAQIKAAGGSIALAAAISKNSDTGTVTTSFNKNGGDKVSPASRTSTITIGYSFNGWKSSSDDKTYSAKATYTLDESTTMTAVWVESGRRGSKVPLPGTKSANSGDKIEKTGYTFDGWYIGDDKYETYSPTESTTLTAQWRANKYTVTFDDNGGNIEGDSSKTVTYDSTYNELPSANRTGYTFGGWFTSKTSDTRIYENTRVSTASDQTLYARWTAETYKVYLNPTNGHFSDNTETSKSYNIKYDESSQYSESDYTPIRIGYNFLGWTTNSDGSDDGHNWLGKLMSSWKWTTDDDVGIQNDNTVYLYPRWESAEVYVNYKIYQGTADAFNVLFDGEDDKLSINDFKLKSVSEVFQNYPDKIKNYHKVFGWYTLKGDEITDFEMLLDNITGIHDGDNIGICDVYAKIGPRYKLLYIDSNGNIGILNLAINSDNKTVYPYIEMKDEEN